MKFFLEMILQIKFGNDLLMTSVAKWIYYYSIFGHL